MGILDLLFGIGLASTATNLISEECSEKKRIKDAAFNGNPVYVDKHGVMRFTKTGLPYKPAYTAEDNLREYREYRAEWLKELYGDDKIGE